MPGEIRDVEVFQTVATGGSLEQALSQVVEVLRLWGEYG